MIPQALCWNRSETPKNLHSALEALGTEYALSETSGVPLQFVPSKNAGALRVCRERDIVRIEYGSPSSALRGVGHALAGQDADESSSFRTLGIMLDCSRNGVMTVPNVKRWMRQLSLLGYNMVMLYTEDTYRLPGEPMFGYMRGAYSMAEIREIDAYAASLGITVIACIQTLGHLHQILKWDAYQPVMDTPGVLLVDGDQTYALIEKMVKFWAEALGSRRIHVGMDEAHDLGRGKFMDKFGHESGFEIFNRHLARICEICKTHGLNPMIWSDMYFRMGSKTQDYYDREAVIPQEVKTKIPKSVELVYWDYYGKDEEFYREWIRRHRDLGSEPIMASGIWTWSRYWYDHGMTEPAVRCAVNACRKENVREILFTMWGDGGSYCEFDSAFAGLAFAADLSYGGDGNTDHIAPILKAASGSDYATLLIGSEIQITVDKDIPHVNAITIMWDDALLGIGWQGYRFAGKDFWQRVLAKLRPIREKLTPHKSSLAGPDYGYLWNLVNVMVLKLEFREALVAAYFAKDREALRKLREKEIPLILSALAELEVSFRRQWLRRNKPFGMEVIQIRLGALSTRYRETSLRIGELLDGKISGIDELDAQPEDIGKNVVVFFDWLSTGSLLI